MLTGQLSASLCMVPLWVFPCLPYIGHEIFPLPNLVNHGTIVVANGIGVARNCIVGWEEQRNAWSLFTA